MTWLTDNKKFTVFLIVTFLYIYMVISSKYGFPISGEERGLVLGAWLLALKEWFDGKPDKL